MNEPLPSNVPSAAFPAPVAGVVDPRSESDASDMPDPNEAFDENGVDLTLLAWFGTLSVLERLEWVCARSEELLALGVDPFADDGPFMFEEA